MGSYSKLAFKILVDNWNYYNEGYKTEPEREVVASIDKEIKESLKVKRLPDKRYVPDDDEVSLCESQFPLSVNITL